MSGMEEYDALPEWLDKFKETKQNSSPSPLPGDLGKEEGRRNANEGVPEQRQQESSQSVKESVDMGESASISNSSTPRQKIAGTVENGSHIIQVNVEFNGEPVDKLSSGRAGDTKPKNAEDNVAMHSLKVEAHKNEGDGDGDGLLSKDEMVARAEFGHELFAQVISLRSSLLSCGQADELPEEINLLRTTPGSKLPILLSALRAWEVDDSVTLMLVGKFVTESDGYAQSTRILQSVVLPKLLKLDKPATRVLIAAVVHAGKAHPRATMDAVLFPLICSEKGANGVQCDLLNRMVKDCLPAGLNLTLCEKMFAAWSSKDPLSGPEPSKARWVWTEGMIAVVQNLLTHRLDLDQDTLAGLVCALDGVAMEYMSSLKFANLLLNLITRYGPQLTPHKAILQGVADKSKTFLTKSLLTKLSAL